LSPRQVAGIYENNLDSRNSGLVGRELTQLVESPSVALGSRFLPDFRSEPNSRQILESERRVRFHGFFYQLFRDIVVNPRLKPRFLPRKPSKETFRPLSAFGLNRGSCSDKTVTGFSKLIPVPRFACASGGDVPNAEVNSDYFRGLPFGLFRYLHDYIDVVIALSGFTKGCARGILPFEQTDLVSPDQEIELNTTAFQCYPYPLFLFVVNESPNIESNGTWSETVYLFDSFGVPDNPPYRLTDVVRFKSCSRSNRVIDLVMQFGGIPAIISLGYRQYLITGIRKRVQSLVNFWAKLYRNFNLATYRQGLSHAPIITHPSFTAVKTAESIFLCHLKMAVSNLPENLL
jgi:hypothetical protein